MVPTLARGLSRGLTSVLQRNGRMASRRLSEKGWCSMEHTQEQLFDRRGENWPPPTTQHVRMELRFDLRTNDPGYSATVSIHDGTDGEQLEWSDHELAYTIGGWAQAMALIAWQLERARHYLETFD